MRKLWNKTLLNIALIFAGNLWPWSGALKMAWGWKEVRGNMGVGRGESSQWSTRVFNLLCVLKGGIFRNRCQLRGGMRHLCISLITEKSNWIELSYYIYNNPLAALSLTATPRQTLSTSPTFFRTIRWQLENKEIFKGEKHEWQHCKGLNWMDEKGSERFIVLD